MLFRGSGGPGGHPGAYFSEKTPPKVKNGYETSWVEALVQSYGGFFSLKYALGWPPDPLKRIFMFGADVF